MTIAIIAAMDEELACLLRDMSHRKETVINGRPFYQGQLAGQAIVATLCGVGKVETALTLAQLKYVFHTNAVVMTGLAGSLTPKLSIGSAVVAEHYLYHDVDATPNFPKHELPFLGTAVFEGDRAFTKLALTATQQYLSTQLKQDIAPQDLAQFQITQPICMTGLIASGDQFITDPAKLKRIREDIKSVNGLEALCVDMESAAMAHACGRLGIKRFSAIRVISDSGQNFDYLRFKHSIASLYTAGIVKQLLTLLTLERSANTTSSSVTPAL